MTRYHLTLRSENVKTGPIPVSTTSADTCPKTCGQFRTCYAKHGPMAINWGLINKGARGTSLAKFARAIKALPDGTLWRHNQAGDLPGRDGTIDADALGKLVAANRGKRGFTYTHKPLTRANARAIARANREGFTVNVSADTVALADAARVKNVGPVVCVLPMGTRAGFKTPMGNKVVLCPAVTHGVTCATCKLCAWKDRQVIIGFPAHGARARQVPADALVQIGAA